MTTIAFTQNVMACDALWTENGMKAVKRTKIFRNKYGVLIGYAGSNDSRALHILLEKVKTPKNLPTHDQLLSLHFDSHALVVFPPQKPNVNPKIFTITTLPFHYDVNEGDVGITEISYPFWAVGSGSPYALGAMRQGASAYEAVKAGIEFDLNSDDPVYKLTLIDLTKKKYSV